MKLVLAIVNSRDIRPLRSALISGDYRFTELGSTGGFMRQGNTTILCGVEDEAVEPLLKLLAEHCRRREEIVNLVAADTKVYGDSVGAPQVVLSGGGLVYVVNVEQARVLE